MNIPKKIVDVGGAILEQYVRLDMDIKKTYDSLEEIESKTISLFVQIQKSIGDYLPKEKERGYGYYGRSSFSDDYNYNCRHIVAALRDANPIEKIYETEEYLKAIRELALDSKVEHSLKKKLESEMSALKKQYG